MASPIFAITDGETRVNLISKAGSGINVLEYTPARQDAKNGGVWADSSLSDGRQMKMRKLSNAVDVLTLGISGANQDRVIESARDLTTLLEKAVSYFISEWQNEPVWLERRGSKETNTSYTLIHGYKWENDSNPFAPPFNVPGKPSAQIIELAIEHGPWLSNPPGESECVIISNGMTGAGSEETVAPTQDTDDAHVYHFINYLSTIYPSVVNDDATVNHTDSSILLSGITLNFGKGSTQVWDSGIRFRNILIPNSAEIISANITFTPSLTNAGERNLNIRGELSASPSEFSTYLDFNTRTRTSATVNWTGSEWGYYGAPQVTPNIGSITQEIVNLVGWNSGDDMVIFVEESGSSAGINRAYSVDIFASKRAKLDIVYRGLDDVISTTSTYLSFGVSDLQDSDCGIRFQSVNVPEDANILKARLSFSAAQNSIPSTGFSGTALIYGELDAAPNVFSTYADFVGRSLTEESVNFPLYRWLTGVRVETPDISLIVQEVIRQAGWTQGDDIALFIQSNTGNNQVFPASFDNVVYGEPELEITYSIGDEMGHEPSCSDEIYIANKDNLASLSHVYNDDGGVFSDNLLLEAWPYYIFPQATAIGDAVYFGSTVGIFNSLVFDFVNAANFAFDWEYYDGAAWATLTVTPDETGVDLFSAGVGAVTWYPPEDWAEVDVNGVTIFWVRGIATSAGDAPLQQERHVYTITRSSIDIGETQGDITALARITTLNTNSARGNAEKIIIGVRSLYRGEDFRQHINVDEQNDPRITTTISGLLTTVEDSNHAPTGSVLRTAFGAAVDPTEEWRVTVSPPLAQQYYGRYRIFARFYCSDALADGDIQSSIQIVMGSERMSKQIGNVGSGTDLYYFDYGILSIPPSIIPLTFEGSFDLRVYVGNSFGAVDIDWMDLVLVPIDEYALEIVQTPLGSNLGLTTTDSTTYVGKGNIFATLTSIADGNISDIPSVISAGPVQIQSGEGQCVYWFVPEDANYEWIGRVTLTKNERFLTFRGGS